MTFFRPHIYSDVIELLPDSGWKFILQKATALKGEGSPLDSHLYIGYAPAKIVISDSFVINDGVFCTWGFAKRDAYCYSSDNDDGTVCEIARNPDQFMYSWIQRNYIDKECIREMAELLGFPDVMLAVEKYRGDHTFQHIPEMQRSRPLTLVRDDEKEEDYDGLAPCLKNLSPESVREWTVPETNSRAFHRGTEETLLPAVLNSGFAPPWFLTEDQQTVFYKLLRAGDHQGAWMSLNSSQWTMEDARRAILELAKEVERPLFKEFARAWVALPFPDDWWY